MREADVLTHFTCDFCRNEFDRRGHPSIDRKGFVKIRGCVQACPNCLSAANLRFRLEERHHDNRPNESAGPVEEGGNQK